MLLLIERGGIYERDKQWYFAAYDYNSAMQFSPDYAPGAEALAKLSKNHPAEAKKAAAQVLKDFQGEQTPGSSTSPTVTPAP